MSFFYTGQLSDFLQHSFFNFEYLLARLYSTNVSRVIQDMQVDKFENREHAGLFKETGYLIPLVETVGGNQQGKGATAPETC